MEGNVGVNWYEIAKMAYEAHVQKAAEFNVEIEEPFDSLELYDREGWIAAVQTACSVYATACTT